MRQAKFKVVDIEKLNIKVPGEFNQVCCRKGKSFFFVNLPTGFGKLFIYQALPIVFSSVQSTCEKHIVVVISPLTT